MAKTPKGKSQRMTRRCMWKVTSSAPRPRMRPTLAMLLPTTLPMAISGLPSITAVSETTSSGSDVPKPMITAPTTVLGTRWAVARCAAWATSRSPPRKSSRMPPATAAEGSTIVHG